MPKFGRGLNREVVAAVNSGSLAEPLTTESVRDLARTRGWKVTDAYVAVALANGASDGHSSTYRKYFHSVDRGRYEVRQEYRGQNWK